MPYAFFDDHFPEIAKRETRTIIVFEDSLLGLPPGEYMLLEMYCNEPGCDCRRVFFYVVSPPRGHALAVVAYGWENREFYERWYGHDDPEVVDELKGPVLNLASPQTDLAPAILDAIENVVLQDELYVERLKTHYRMFRDKIDRKAAARSRWAAPSRKGTASQKEKKKKTTGKRKKKKRKR